eukprot:766680-Hanusia_phi.AAC.8
MGGEAWWIGAVVVAAIAVSIMRIIFKVRSQEAFIRNFKEEGDILLVIAHPDDEAMFFTPTILALKDSVKIHVMSLSNGDYAGLGWVRASELVESCRMLGIPKERVSVVDDPSLQVFLYHAHDTANSCLKDGPTNSWSAETISLYVLPYLKKNGISVVITFDDYGISGRFEDMSCCRAALREFSGHPNHIALHTAFVKLVQTKRIEKGKAWKLQSVNLLRKYLGPLSVLENDALQWLGSNSSTSQTVYCWDLGSVWKCLKVRLVNNNTEFSSLYTELQAHGSQCEWFRHLFIVFGRYSYMNTLDLVEG